MNCQTFRRHILLPSSGRLNYVHMDPSSFSTALIYNVSSIFPKNRHFRIYMNRCSHTGQEKYVPPKRHNTLLPHAAEPRKKTNLLSTAMKTCELINMEENDTILAVFARVFFVRCAPLWAYPNTTDDLSFRSAQV